MKKCLWRSSSLVKLQVFSLQLYEKMNSLAGIFQCFCQLYRNIYFQEQLWTAASEFLLKGISEHPVISFITYFHTLKPWNEINEDRILIDRWKNRIPVNSFETDLLHHAHDKHECYHNLLGGLNFNQPGPTKTFIRRKKQIMNLFCGIFIIWMIVTTNNSTVDHIITSTEACFCLLH